MGVQHVNCWTFWRKPPTVFTKYLSTPVVWIPFIPLDGILFTEVYAILMVIPYVSCLRASMRTRFHRKKKCVFNPDLLPFFDARLSRRRHMKQEWHEGWCRHTFSMLRNPEWACDSYDGTSAIAAEIRVEADAIDVKVHIVTKNRIYWLIITIML